MDTFPHLFRMVLLLFPYDHAHDVRALHVPLVAGEVFCCEAVHDDRRTDHAHYRTSANHEYDEHVKN